MIQITHPSCFRLTAINCVVAHTLTHPKMTTDYHITDPALELLAVNNMLSSILPGVLAALQDVATCNNNPGHKVIVVSDLRLGKDLGPISCKYSASLHFI